MNTDVKILNGYANDLYLAADSLGLTQWEQDFVFDMVAMKSYSPKQSETLMKLAEKYDV